MQVIGGKYEVVKVIGEGASGRVYLVRHVDLGSMYALKLLDPTLALEARFIDRFKTEAEMLRRFSHPGSVQLRDFGKTEEGLYYMAMDFCAGTPLKDLIQERGNYPVLESLDLIIRMLEIVEAAHAVGIIHRDIKPENVMIEPGLDGKSQLRILDFGIAKLKEIPEGSRRVTLEGASIGTPQYMSPEQAAGEKNLDHRVDVYSVGVVLYEMLTGRVPFQGKNVVHTLLMQITQAPPPFDPALKVPAALEQAVMKALEKDADRRFQSAAEFRSACQAVLDQLKQAKGAEAGQASTPATAVKPTAPVWGGKELKGERQYKILCLDDQEMIINILKHLLEKEGYLVQTSTDWAVIHEYLFSDEVDLLISDVEMPGMKGTAVCQILKETMPSLKIVLFSNVPERQLEKMAAQAHADAWISKNKAPAEWLSDIKEVLER